MKKIGLKYRAVYLLGFPLAGVLIGIAVFALFNYVNGPLSKFALYLSVGVWGGYGVFSGTYGYLNLRKILKLKRANEESKD
ncbi:MULTISPECIES: hypothetical protein [Aeromonas]|uniref:Uncharacterized protein n=1 Tax=Aeromonas allosaccharophila TaxID=656 RepID=A0AAX3NYP7_9GAMM|nr:MULTISPECIES: hypothetical protein [Aeromonas]WED79228.1 hypothetical protein PYU98_25070 [Aeromonas allosaccharophila]